MKCLAGSFELTSLAGRGAFADVWRGEHKTDGYAAAIKIPRGHGFMTPRLDEQFLREVRSTARLEHPGVIDIWDYGRLTHPIHPDSDHFYDENTPFFVMEWSDGGTLSSAIDSLNWPTLQRTLLLLLDALGMAHSRGIIHRDIKPDNILLSDRGPVLSDFGIAFVEESVQTEAASRTIFGTPSFMSPEQICGEVCMYGPWTDLYAVGCLTFLAVTGERPFKGASFPDIATAHLRADIPQMTPRFDVPDGLAKWIQRLLHKAPHRRYQFAADAIFDLLKLAPVPAATDHPSDLDIFLNQEDEWTHDTLIDPTKSSAPVDVPVYFKSLETLVRPSELPEIPSSWASQETDSAGPAKHGLGRALFAWSNSNIIGRDAERSALWSALKAARDEKSLGIVGLTGRPGIGKSALVRWLREHAHATGVADTWVMTHEFPNSNSCGLAGMLRRALRVQGMPPEKAWSQIDQLCSRLGLADFSDALKAILDDGRPTHETRPQNRPIGLVERFEALSQLLAALSRTRTMIVSIDDVQWGDTALGWLEVLASRWSDIPVLVVCTLRADLVHDRHPACVTFNPWVVSGLADMLRIDPLPPADLAKIVSQRLRVDGETLNAAVEKTQGNPLFLESMVNHWIQQGSLVRGRDGFRLHGQVQLTLPESINRVWWDRLTAFVEVDGVLWQSLELAAIIGVQVDGDEWTTVCESASVPSDAYLVSQLEEGELVRCDDFHGWSFQHVLFRDFLVSHAQNSGRIKRWHRLIAEMLQSSRSATNERIGFHWLRGGRPDKAVEPLEQARKDAAQMHDYRATQRVIMHEASALRQSGYRLLSDEWQLMASRWHFVSRATGHRERAAHRLGLLNQRCREANLRLGLARGLIERALTLGGLGRLKDAIEHQRDALLVAEEIGDQETAHSTRNYLGYSLTYAGQHDEAETLLKETLVQVQGIPAYRSLQVDALRGLISLWTGQGRLDEAKTAADAAFELIDETIPTYHIGILSMVGGQLELARGDVDSATTLFRRSVDALRRIGNADVWATEYCLATAYVKTSRWAEAHETISHSAKSAQLFDAVDGVHMTHCYASLTASKLGLWDELETHLAYLESETPRVMSETIEDLARATTFLDADSPIKPSRVWRICAKLYEKAGVTAKAE